MTELSRRDLIIGAAAALASASVPATPTPVAVPLALEVIPAWAVGTPGEFDWQHVTGRTVEEAIRNYMREKIGGDGCEDGGGPDCDCEWCSTIGGLDAERKPIWDGQDATSAGDWLRAGMGSICSRCGYECFGDDGAQPVVDEAVCSDCMTLTDWDIVDPGRAAEIRAAGRSPEERAT